MPPAQKRGRHFLLLTLKYLRIIASYVRGNFNSPAYIAELFKIWFRRIYGRNTAAVQSAATTFMPLPPLRGYARSRRTIHRLYKVLRAAFSLPRR